VLAWGAAPAGQVRGPRVQGPPTTLATPWPARDGCPSYQGIDVSVDDGATSVEWRGAGGAALAFDVEKPFPPERDPEYRLGSEGFDCHVRGTSCLVYRKPIGRRLRVRAARARRLLPAGFKAGSFEQLVVYRNAQPRGRSSRAGGSSDLGLSLIVRCLDRSKPSVAWACDARSCVPRTFRDNVKMQAFWKAEANKPRREQRGMPADEVPNWQRWRKGDPPKNLTSLICMRGQTGLAEVERAARKSNGHLVCDEKSPVAPVKKLPFAEARPMLIDLGRDLLREMDMVLDEGCAGACSTRIDELRTTARALAAASDLRLVGVRAAFHDSHDEFGYGAYPSLGFVASLAARAGALEVVCARRRTFTSMGLPDAEECRLTVLAGGHRLADYSPDYEPFIELPDGGAVRLLDAPPSPDDPFNHPRDQIVVIGSALAQQPR
jgi:hypothetical protein